MATADPDAAPAPALKEMFNEARYRALADDISHVYPAFDRKRFLTLTLAGLAERSLLQRLRQTSEALRATLPDDYAKALAVLRALAPRVKHTFVSIVFPDFVGLYGAGHYELSLEALKFFTPFGSSEFGIRPFLRSDLKRTLRVMESWAGDADEHVRRLASEGSRPRLPWSFRLDPIVRDPELTAPILEKLLNDPSLYVRKSVANHLNDHSKDHPEWLIDWLQAHEMQSAHPRWIARRALRTLIKKGHPRALGLIGVTGKADLAAVEFSLAPKRVKLGGRIELSLTVRTAGRNPQRLVIDYAMHFVKSNGSTSGKVFKWKEVTLEAGAMLELSKTQRIQDFTTRKHHPGRHRVELLINGHPVAESAFVLNR